MMGRGAGPRDIQLFATHHLPNLSAAVLDLSFLLERQYAETSALKLVGDHFQIHLRQRQAVMRAAAGPSEIQRRQQTRVDALAGQTLAVDGFNVVILLEAAMGGGLILHCADDTYRDLSSIHGNYHLVEQTEEGLTWFGQYCAEQGVANVEWWLDAPVSNSGRLAALMRDLAATHGWPWQVQTDPHVDSLLRASDAVVVTSDKIILNTCRRWANLGRLLVDDAHAKGKLPLLWKMELPQPTERHSLQTQFSFLPETIVIQDDTAS